MRRQLVLGILGGGELGFPQRVDRPNDVAQGRGLGLECGAIGIGPRSSRVDALDQQLFELGLASRPIATGLGGQLLPEQFDFGGLQAVVGRRVFIGFAPSFPAVVQELDFLLDCLGVFHVPFVGRQPLFVALGHRQLGL